MKTTVLYIECYGIPFVETLSRHEVVILFIDTWDAWNHPTILCATSWIISYHVLFIHHMVKSMFEILAWYVLFVAITAINEIIIYQTVSDCFSLFRSEKVSSLILLDFFCLIILISKDSSSYYIPCTATMLETQVALSECNVVFAIINMYTDPLWFMIIDKGYFKSSILNLVFTLLHFFGNDISFG